MDDWQFIPLLEKASQGQLTFGDLWAPHDEHRLLIPRIVIIASMFAFKGDYRMQCCISFLVVEVISLGFLWLMLRLNGEHLGVWVTWSLANSRGSFYYHLEGDRELPVSPAVLEANLHAER